MGVKIELQTKVKMDKEQSEYASDNDEQGEDTI